MFLINIAQTVNIVAYTQQIEIFHRSTKIVFITRSFFVFSPRVRPCSIFAQKCMCYLFVIFFVNHAANDFLEDEKRNALVQEVIKSVARRHTQGGDTK